ncbi:hypothetical protein ABVN80_05260 [Acinetobacter baumannii]
MIEVDKILPKIKQNYYFKFAMNWCLKLIQTLQMNFQNKLRIVMQSVLEISVPLVVK